MSQSSFLPVYAQIAARFGDRAQTGTAVREQHGKDASFHPAVAPDLVVYPQDTAEVSWVVGLCHQHRVPVVPFGTGTACEGGVAALHGGVCIDMGRMDRILRVDAADMDCRVQAGVTRKRLNAELHGTGLQFPIDPGADASIGGMVSTRASGTNAVRYGTMRENVLSLQVVLPDGEVIETGNRARKSAAGYDITRAFVGAEGTLGVVTEIALKLHPLPERISAARCSYPDLRAAIDTVIQVIQVGVPIGRVELMDERQVAASNRYSKLELPEAPTLFFEFHGSPQAVDEQVETVRAISAEHGGRDFAWAATPEERTRLWQARHDAWWAALALRRGCEGMPTDVCVPISRLAESVLAARADVDELGLTAPMCGHVGDGNFHLCVVLDLADEAEMQRAQELYDRLVRRAIAMEGTCTGEHGIGYGKLDYLRQERGGSMRVLAAIKRALDPRNIMNPGKVVLADGYRAFD
jgi:D-lactate dehydrogenase (cytochrome)